MIKTNPKKDLDLLKGLCELRIEMRKLEKELSSDPNSNPKIEKLIHILSLVYPVWASIVFSSGKRRHMSRKPRVFVRHAVMSPRNGWHRCVLAKKDRWMFTPEKYVIRPWIPKGEFNSHPVPHFLPKSGSGLTHRADEIPSKEKHYHRNWFMSDVPQNPQMAADWGWDDSVGVACHQFLSPDRSNIKFVSPDGHSEVIFDRDGHIVTDSEDYGTYNFCDSRKDPIGHFYQDVLPWLLWGNDRKDSTDMGQRLRSLVVFDDSESSLPRVDM